MNRLLILFLISASSVLIAWACQVPVFRFALERWPSDTYRILVLHHGELTPSHRQTVSMLTNATANIETRIVNLDKLSEAERWRLPDLPDPNPNEALTCLLLPVQADDDHPLAVQSLSSNAVLPWIRTEPRQELSTRILQGASVVWLLVEGEDAETNDALAKRLQGWLEEAAAGQTISDQVIFPEELGANTNRTIDLDDVLRSTVPLRIDFQVQRLKPGTDPTLERLLASLMPPRPRPFAVPVFGRGRMLPMPPGPLTQEQVTGACDYLCGACSCQVKEQNPGVDLLFEADWVRSLQGSSVMIEKTLPPMSGPGDLVSKVRGSGYYRWLLVTTGFAILAVGLFSLRFKF